MGIQRLTQDLSPYVEAAVLGDRHGNSDGAVFVKDVIVDGPSLAYHVYNNLLAYHLLRSGQDRPRLPTYREIGDATNRFLSDLATNAVDIRAVFFDGSLPKAKQDTRLARLESTRKQLDDFRRLHHEPPRSVSTMHSIDHQKALWSHATLSARQSLPPPPPFLVPAVIEALQQSKWSHVLQVVPEEADVACARMAQSSGSALLSNDSDMCIYDLGSVACVVQLHTLEKQQQNANYVIRGSCVRPLALATRLRVPSLLRLAYERLSDSSASFSVILNKARMTQTSDDQAKFGHFKAEYKVPQPRVLGSALQGLDPRVAEFVVEASSSTDAQPLSVYLPMLYEDPQRDASWSYGQDFRQLAYSIYTAMNQGPTRHVKEYSRKGARITSNDTPILKASDLDQVIIATCESLDNRSTTFHEAGLATSWYIVGLRFVTQQRLGYGKTVSRAEINALFDLSRNDQAITWPSVHTHACTEALLYSLRMLKQLTDLALKAQSMDKANLRSVRRLAGSLRDMPPIAELFVPIAQLREIYQDLQNTDLLEPILTLLPASRESKKSLPGRRLSAPTKTPGHPAKRAKTQAETKTTTSAHHNLFDVLSEISR